jgi:hypothetical protein
MAAVDDLIREYTSLATDFDTRAAATLAPGQLGPDALSMPMPIGTRVLDLVTGETGVVISGKSENVIISAAI